jgi:hypothetical protein
MTSTNDYLKRHFLNKSQLADTCAISCSALDELILAGLVPEPSYRVTGEGKMFSQAFGELPPDHAEPGEYFHRRGASWVHRAMAAQAEFGAQQARQVLRRQFTDNFRTALQDLDRTVARLPDSFTDTGAPIADGLASRLDAAWGYFLNGVFNLCVNDPSTEQSIARKEVLQETLSRLTDNGVKSDFIESERVLVLSLIEQYAQAAMPFSPPEYPRSSRKRLVEDLLVKLAP